MSAAHPITVDTVSLLVEAHASESLDALEKELAARGFTLGLVHARGEDERVTVGTWLAQGAPGSASLFADPSDHLVAGLVGRLHDGRTLEVRPNPRRAVGPDLTALLVGAQARFGTLERAWLRIHRRDARRPSMPLPLVELDPPVSDAEAQLLDAIAAALQGCAG